MSEDHVVRLDETTTVMFFSTCLIVTNLDEAEGTEDQVVLTYENLDIINQKAREFR